MAERKNIFVTGAASGIGRETARLFAEHGWFVGLFDVNMDGLAAVRDEIGADNCCVQEVDVTDPTSVQRAVETYLQQTNGRMDVLFACAGILQMGDNADIPLARQTAIVDVNIAGVLTTIHAGLPALKDTPGAHIVSMCSASALYGVPGFAVYSASKFFVRGLTEALNIEYERHGITVSDILVAFVETPMVTDADVKMDSIERMGVNVQPRQVAEAVWNAAHGRKVHWFVGRDSPAMRFVLWAFPFARKSLMKFLTGYK